MPMHQKSYLTPDISLTDEEAQLTTLLQEACKRGAFSDSNVVVRYAGGWVRDKILHKQSHDIDIVVSSLTGHTFAVEFAAYLASHHPNLKQGSVSKILANPEKSKHLDTATSKFLSLDLDFVQLRTEEYGSLDSRTPDVIGVGTLVQDAERRDCTMNALYYNIHDMSVEDPTRQGLCDLTQGLLKTPLAPKKTFLDDPLRMLRCIRFASQFGFDIDPVTFDEMKEIDVRRALKGKVVKERVGIEVWKMMKGIDPEKAIRAMHSQGLYHTVFMDLEPDTVVPWFDFSVVDQAITVLRGSDALKAHLSDFADGRLWLIIAMLPYRDEMRAVPKKTDIMEPLGCVMIRNTLKLTGALETLVKAVFPPREITLNKTSSRLELGKMVRNLKKDWKLALFVSHLSSGSTMTTEALIELMDRVAALELESAWSAMPFVDGKKIKPLLLESGAHIKVMRELMELVVEFKMEQPEITEEETMAKLRDYLRNRPVGAEGW